MMCTYIRSVFNGTLLDGSENKSFIRRHHPGSQAPSRGHHGRLLAVLLHRHAARAEERHAQRHHPRRHGVRVCLPAPRLRLLLASASSLQKWTGVCADARTLETHALHALAQDL